MSASLYAATIAFLLVALFILFRKSKATSASLPPGPKPIPVLGNLRDLVAQELWLHAEQWGKEYGGVVYLHVLGQGVVFLNNSEAAFELMDKRGAIYSDKPQLVMVGELCGCKHMVAFTSYGDEFKRQRKYLRQAFGPDVIPAYHPLIEKETNNFLRSLLSDPSDYIKHTRRYAGGLTLSVVYGYEPNSSDDEMFRLAEECLSLLSTKIASGDGLWPVDIIPSLKYLPLWFPGAGFKRKAIIWKAKMEEFAEKPYQYVKESMKTGNYKPSFASTILEANSSKLTEELEFDLKWSTNSMYAASADTTMTTVSHFIIAMMQHPEVLKKAQMEIDTVIGSDRLPTFADRSALPYIESVMSETWRWGVPLPLNLPHSLAKDDVYRDMYIPKGSLVFANIWAMLRDESIYPNADKFIPERFLEKVDEVTKRKRDPRTYVFGFGRRLCPGLNLVESSIWLLIARMLATLQIGKPIDGTGKPYMPELKFNNPIFRIPDPFKCEIRPRSEKTLQLILDTEFF